MIRFLRWRARLRELRIQLDTLWLAVRDARVPIAPKLIVAAVAAYLVSPIDLVTDLIPILGYLDDLGVLTFGAGLALRAIPPRLREELHGKAVARAGRRSRRARTAIWIAAFAVVLVVAILAARALLAPD